MHPSQDPILTTALLTSLILCVLFTAFIIVIVNTQRRYYTLRQKSFRSEVETLKKERIRIAADVHDELSPLLTLAYRQVEAAQDGRGEATELLPLARQNLYILINRVGEIIFNMNDERIVNDGFQQSAKDFLNQHALLSNLHIQFHCSIKTALSDVHTISLYRMLQELVQNTFKHSRATHIVVHLKEWRDHLYFYYADDGASNNQRQDLAGTGIGQKSLQHRILLLGGTLEVTKEKGIQYRFQIPLH